MCDGWRRSIQNKKHMPPWRRDAGVRGCSNCAGASCARERRENGSTPHRVAMCTGCCCGPRSGEEDQRNKLKLTSYKRDFQCRLGSLMKDDIIDSVNPVISPISDRNCIRWLLETGVKVRRNVHLNSELYSSSMLVKRARVFQRYLKHTLGVFVCPIRILGLRIRSRYKDSTVME